MRITKLIVKNIAPIFAAMGRKELTIDLTNQKNRVVLLIGTNGTGKTTILSMLDPEPFPDDSRGGGKEFILEGHDGYKEIHYSHDNHHYIIKHHYLYKNDKGVKSFISKDGVELNPNGNAKSFKELIEIELSIESDMFRLLRLGSNVAGFIDMKTSERKSFMSDLLKDINIYLKLHKKVNDDSRTIKSVLKNIGDKIMKLKVYDEKEEKLTINELQERLIHLRKDKESYVSEIGRLNGVIESLTPGGYESFVSEITQNEQERRKLASINVELERKLKSKMIVVVGHIDDEINKIQSLMANTSNEITLNKTKIDFFFNQLNSLHKQREDKEESFKYVSSELQYDKLNSHLLQLNRDRNKYIERFKDFTPTCDKDDMLRAMSLLQDIDGIVSTIYDYSNTAVKEVIDFVRRGDIIDNIVRSEVGKIDSRIRRLQNDIHRASDTSMFDKRVYVFLEDPNHNCSYKQFYEDNKPKENPESFTESARNEIATLEAKRERVMGYQDIGKKIEYIFMVIRSNKELISKLPENFFDIPTLLTNIREFKPVYNEDYMTNYVSVLEDYEVFKNIDVKMAETKKEIEFIRKNSSSISSLQDELRSIDESIYTIEKELEKLRSINKDLENKHDINERLLESYYNYRELNDTASENHAKLVNLTEWLGDRYQIQQSLQGHVTTIKHLTDKLSTIDDEVKTIESSIQDISFRLREFQSLNEEKTLLDQKFEEIDLIRESLSTNKGIPLLFINLFLKNSRSHVNQLITSIYDDLEIDDFVIDEKDFKIPYIKKGIRVSDAVKCSQGERTFISLAISFALISLTPTLRVHNIMRLDEIDATLHASYREKFISIIENQLDLIGAEQVFVISHNNMFDNQQVDVIMTSDERIENTRNVHILFKPATQEDFT